jgi:hypoxanthine phosphoribosyltransferase
MVIFCLETIEFLTLSWDEIYDKLMVLAEKILASNFLPHVIVGIARGGWITARIMSDLLSNPTTGNVRCELYEHLGVMRGKAAVTQPISVDITNKVILLCDDVADSGGSLEATAEHLRSKNPKEIRSATIHRKPHTRFSPDYFVEETKKWIIYPWERRETINDMIEKFNVKPDSRVLAKRTKIEKHFIDKYLEWDKKYRR